MKLSGLDLRPAAGGLRRGRRSSGASGTRPSEGPCVVRTRRRRRLRHLRRGADHARPLRGGRPGGACPRRQGPARRHARGYPAEHAARGPRSDAAVAHRAERPAGDQGGGRDFRRLHAGAGDRGAGARRGGARQRDPRRDHRHDRRRPAQAEAGLGAGEGAEGRCSSRRASGRNISKSASGRTPRSSPRRSRCRRSGTSRRRG